MSKKDRLEELDFKADCFCGHKCEEDYSWNQQNNSSGIKPRWNRQKLFNFQILFTSRSPSESILKEGQKSNLIQYLKSGIDPRLIM